ncbi:hypothetical protein [Candidatus Kinetoplastidibacterium crithidiae]|uniref:Uncharacterized protein n=1 Tax=Candidatus Kinetoplastidibacterium crithidiae TCC036E TaxID=1208918 RepID=M1M610_9PROT|nr:hypothetical protein [Candidatus Kinetoplastibacterium crithidii]AFZ82773.1 hypothetical protein CKCE_0340 [Candidatus Kinetoplastibacterium crithidii (ex Angomonas deanei ATCC 30255)]AGF47575.1 hypothetical protein CDEE_0539 [Candidatus Kinetoplastibacterium crithidii TCC036E]
MIADINCFSIATMVTSKVSIIKYQNYDSTNYSNRIAANKRALSYGTTKKSDILIDKISDFPIYFRKTKYYSNDNKSNNHNKDYKIHTYYALFLYTFRELKYQQFKLKNFLEQLRTLEIVIIWKLAYLIIIKKLEIYGSQ